MQNVLAAIIDANQIAVSICRGNTHVRHNSVSHFDPDAPGRSASMAAQSKLGIQTDGWTRPDCCNSVGTHFDGTHLTLKSA